MDVSGLSGREWTQWTRGGLWPGLAGEAHGLLAPRLWLLAPSSGERELVLGAWWRNDLDNISSSWAHPKEVHAGWAG